MITEIQNQLCSIETRWMLSVSVSSIHMTLEEGTDAVVEFDAAFLPSERSLSFPFGDLEIKRVRIRFENAQWSKTYPLLDRHGLDGKGFDLSRTTRLSINNLEQKLTEFRAKWAHSQTCPDSNFYLVENSTWIDEQNAACFGVKHYLLKGCDLVVELLAKSWCQL